MGWRWMAFAVTAAATAWGGSNTAEPPPPPVRQGDAHGPGRGGYSVEQAVSDRAQLSTIGFSGLAFLTGDFGAATFIPPGKVCDYFGFQYMRDIDAGGNGHNPKFLNRVVGNVLHVLDESQRQQLEALAVEQAGGLEDLARRRWPLIRAFYRQRDGNIPQGSEGLNRDAVRRYVGSLFATDAELSFRRAEVFAAVIASLSPEQKAYLGKMKFGDFATWPDLDERSQPRRPPRGESHLLNVAYMTYASELFSWYAGSTNADTYFCPERHATYFGGFYMKDMPAMGKRDYSISTRVTGDSGEAFLGLLDEKQSAPIVAIIEAQRPELAKIVEIRRAMAVELRKFLGGTRPDRTRVVALGRQYGEIDGDLSWRYAMAFARANRTLTEVQRSALMKLRNLDGYRSAPAYIYSQPSTVPDHFDTEFLFGVSP